MLNPPSLSGEPFHLPMSGDINTEITNDYNKANGRVILDSILYKSKMKDMIDSVFSKYNMYVKKVFIGKYGLVDKSIIKEYNIPVADYELLPSKVIDGYAYFYFKEKSL